MLDIIINIIFLIVFAAAALSVTYDYRLMKAREKATRVHLIFYILAMIIYVGLASSCILSLIG